MRTLKLQVQTTVDGFVAGPNGEQDWITWDWDNQLQNYVDEITSSIDCIILGRKLAEGFIPYWAGVAEDSDNPEQESGKKFTETSKIVFSNTLEESKWDNTVLAQGDMVDEITKLKKQERDDIIAYGGATFVSNLIKENLIDEYYLIINPTAIGKGMLIFDKLASNENLKLIKSISFNCGIVGLHYEPKLDNS